MEEIEVKWSHAIQVWWSWFWRTMLWTLPLSFALGIVLGITFNILGINIEENIHYIHIVGGVLGIYISVKIMKGILGKTFNGYRIALIKVDKPSGMDA